MFRVSGVLQLFDFEPQVIIIRCPSLAETNETIFCKSFPSVSYCASCGADRAFTYGFYHFSFNQNTVTWYIQNILRYTNYNQSTSIDLYEGNPDMIDIAPNVQFNARNLKNFYIGF